MSSPSDSKKPLSPSILNYARIAKRKHDVTFAFYCTVIAACYICLFLVRSAWPRISHWSDKKRLLSILLEDILWISVGLTATGVVWLLAVRRRADSRKKRRLWLALAGSIALVVLAYFSEPLS